MQPTLARGWGERDHCGRRRSMSRLSRLPPLSWTASILLLSRRFLVKPRRVSRAVRPGPDLPPGGLPLPPESDVLRAAPPALDFFAQRFPAPRAVSRCCQLRGRAQTAPPPLDSSAVRLPGSRERFSRHCQLWGRARGSVATGPLRRAVRPRDARSASGSTTTGLLRRAASRPGSTRRASGSTTTGLLPRTPSPPETGVFSSCSSRTGPLRRAVCPATRLLLQAPSSISTRAVAPRRPCVRPAGELHQRDPPPPQRAPPEQLGAARPNTSTARPPLFFPHTPVDRAGHLDTIGERRPACATTLGKSRWPRACSAGACRGLRRCRAPSVTKAQAVRWSPRSGSPDEPTPSSRHHQPAPEECPPKRPSPSRSTARHPTSSRTPDFDESSRDPDTTQQGLGSDNPRRCAERLSAALLAFGACSSSTRIWI